MPSQVRGEVPHNEGIMKYAESKISLLVLPNRGKLSGSIEGGEYDGFWVNGERHGRGRYRFKSTEFKVTSRSANANRLCTFISVHQPFALLAFDVAVRWPVG